MNVPKRFNVVALLALVAFPWEQNTNAAAHAVPQAARPRRRMARSAPFAELQKLVDSVPEVVEELEELALVDEVVEEPVQELAQNDDVPEVAQVATPEVVEVAPEPEAPKAPEPVLVLDETPVVEEEVVVVEPVAPVEAPVHTAASAPESKGFSLASAFNTKNPAWLILLFAFLWGLLVSFTPCVYPLIPITAAVLQSQATTSAVRNFTLAMSYVLGTATVYAALGYLAATTTIIFGQWAGNPWVIAFIVVFMLYLALSMFGYYNLYVPRFLTARKGGEVRGSLLWSYVAGAIAGTIASPCLSPALLTVLLYVSTLGSPIMGFLTLFSFSLGIGVLLLIVGTSSAALSLLPRAGAWLHEVKNVFGFLLLLLAVYFVSLNPSLTFFGFTVQTGYATTAALVGAIALLAGLFYLRSGRKCLVAKQPPKRAPLSLENAEQALAEHQAKHADYVVHCTIGYVKMLFAVLLLGGAALLFVDAYLARCGMGFLNLW